MTKNGMTIRLAGQHLGQQQRERRRPSAPACGTRQTSSPRAPRSPGDTPSSRATTSVLFPIQVSDRPPREHLGERGERSRCRAAGSAADGATARRMTAAGGDDHPVDREQDTSAQPSRARARTSSQRLAARRSPENSSRSARIEQRRRSARSRASARRSPPPCRSGSYSNASRRRGCRASRSRRPARPASRRR